MWYTADHSLCVRMAHVGRAKCHIGSAKRHVVSAKCHVGSGKCHVGRAKCRVGSDKWHTAIAEYRQLILAVITLHILPQENTYSKMS